MVMHAQQGLLNRLAPPGLLQWLPLLALYQARRRKSDGRGGGAPPATTAGLRTALASLSMATLRAWTAEDVKALACLNIQGGPFGPGGTLPGALGGADLLALIAALGLPRVTLGPTARRAMDTAAAGASPQAASPGRGAGAGSPSATTPGSGGRPSPGSTPRMHTVDAELPAGTRRRTMAIPRAHLSPEMGGSTPLPRRRQGKVAAAAQPAAARQRSPEPTPAATAALHTVPEATAGRQHRDTSSVQARRRGAQAASADGRAGSGQTPAPWVGLRSTPRTSPDAGADGLTAAQKEAMRQRLLAGRRFQPSEAKQEAAAATAAHKDWAPNVGREDPHPVPYDATGAQPRRTARKAPKASASAASLSPLHALAAAPFPATAARAAPAPQPKHTTRARQGGSTAVPTEWGSVQSLRTPPGRVEQNIRAAEEASAATMGRTVARHVRQPPRAAAQDDNESLGSTGGSLYSVIPSVFPPPKDKYPAGSVTEEGVPC